MKRRTVAVITRHRTMSGRPGGRRLTLDPATAKDWIARGWCDPEPEQEKRPDERKERRQSA